MAVIFVFGPCWNNLETLKNLAKKFNIPLSTKVQGKWKSLNKNEIYSEISKFLNKNI